MRDQTKVKSGSASNGWKSSERITPLCGISGKVAHAYMVCKVSRQGQVLVGTDPCRPPRREFDSIANDCFASAKHRLKTMMPPGGGAPRQRTTITYSRFFREFKMQYEKASQCLRGMYSLLARAPLHVCTCASEKRPTSTATSWPLSGSQYCPSRCN